MSDKIFTCVSILAQNACESNDGYCNYKTCDECFHTWLMTNEYPMVSDVVWESSPVGPDRVYVVFNTEEEKFMFDLAIEHK